MFAYNRSFFGNRPPDQLSKRDNNFTSLPGDHDFDGMQPYGLLPLTGDRLKTEYYGIDSKSLEPKYECFFNIEWTITEKTNLDCVR